MARVYAVILLRSKPLSQSASAFELLSPRAKALETSSGKRLSETVSDEEVAGLVVSTLFFIGPSDMEEVPMSSVFEEVALVVEGTDNWLLAPPVDNGAEPSSLRLLASVQMN